MACSKATAPINISKKEITDDCFLKCMYKYNYLTSAASTVTNNGNHLSISYDKVRIKFNNDNLLTGDIRIYSPSLHTFDGKHADAEMVITHMDAGISLLVCIPIVVSNGKNEASKQLESLIAQAMEKTPNVGESSVIQTNNFSLNPFIPKKKGLYSYVASLPYTPCNGSHQYIVFTPDESAVFMSTSIVGKLRKMIVNHEIGVKKTRELFYNKRGAIYEGGSTSVDDNEIYIECHPTGSEGEEPVQIKVDDTIKEPTLNFKNPAVITLVGLLAGLLLILIISTVLNFFRGRTATSAIDAATMQGGATSV